MDGDNKYKCDNHGLVRAVKGVEMGMVPEILFVLVKRFYMNWDNECVEKTTGTVHLMIR